MLFLTVRAQQIPGSGTAIEVTSHLELLGARAGAVVDAGNAVIDVTAECHARRSDGPAMPHGDARRRSARRRRRRRGAETR